MDHNEQRAIERGATPRWQGWAVVAVLLGCIATIAATLYDIA